MNEWISVKDRLPEKSTEVLVYRPKMLKKFMTSYFDTDGFCDGAYDLQGREVITHWMTLPQPPMGDELEEDCGLHDGEGSLG